MRNIPANLQTKLETDLGTEIVIVLEIFWGGSATGPSSFYADRSISGTPVKGAILSMSAFDEAVQVSGGGQSASVSVTLDDSDGEIKAEFDRYDIHKAPVKVWFYALGTTFATEKVLVFLGQINSPVEWSEGERTFSLSIVNRIEDVEVGFSAEEGAFPQLPEDLIGRPFPLCFGTTVNVPALKAVPAVSGALANGVGIADFTLPRRLALANLITCPQTPVGFKCVTRVAGIGYNANCNIAFETDVSCLQAKCVEVERLELQLAEQQSYEYAEITIFNGTRFPQGRVITLNINGGLFTGFFDGTPSNPSTTFKIQSRKHPLYDPATGSVLVDELQAAIESACPGSPDDAQDSDFTDTSFGPVFTGLRSSRVSWENYRNAKSAEFFWASGGSTVTLESVKEIIYIANIVPSTILRVAAWRTLNGNRFLLTVPSEYYEVRQTDYNGYQVMEIVFQRPLSNENLKEGGGWSDEIFVSQTSSVGPNTVDIIRWLIETYTNYAIDETSFDAVEAALTAYPMHFPLLRRPNLLDLLEELAKKARCALWMKADTFFIKYLSATPSTVASITTDDILTDDNGIGSLSIHLTKTEDLVTKYVANWKKDYSIDKDNRLILRHNIVKYGTHEREEDYYPYAHLDLVRKSATFWLIRLANTWKKLRFSLSLEFLKLEPFDAVAITLPQVATGQFIGIVERATLNTNEKQIDVEVWTPIRAGELTPYLFAFPAAISENAIFPTIEARNEGQAGSGTDPNFSVISPPGHPLRSDTTGVYQGATLGCNGAPSTSIQPGSCRQDHGDGRPSDVGDQAPTVDVPADATGNVSTGTSPVTGQQGTGYWGLQQYLMDQAKKTEADAGRARETGALIDDDTGSTGQSSDSPVNRDYLDDLPDPDDVVGCNVKVTVTGAGRVESGTRPICLPQPVRTEVYSFDSRAAAEEFCAGLRANSRCSSVAPCTQCINGCVIDASGCTGDEGDGSLVGFRGAPGFTSTSFMQGSK